MADPIVKQMQAANLTMESTRRLQRLSTDVTSMRREGQNDADLKAASEQFESLLLNFMIREMRATIPESGLLAKSMAEDVFTSMLDEQYGDMMAANGGIGLARIIVEQMGQKGSTDD